MLLNCDAISKANSAVAAGDAPITVVCIPRIGASGGTSAPFARPEAMVDVSERPSIAGAPPVRVFDATSDTCDLFKVFMPAIVDYDVLITSAAPGPVDSPVAYKNNALLQEGATMIHVAACALLGYANVSMGGVRSCANLQFWGDPANAAVAALLRKHGALALSRWDARSFATFDAVDAISSRLAMAIYEMGQGAAGGTVGGVAVGVHEAAACADHRLPQTLGPNPAGFLSVLAAIHLLPVIRASFPELYKSLDADPRRATSFVSEIAADLHALLFYDATEAQRLASSLVTRRSIEQVAQLRTIISNKQAAYVAALVPSPPYTSVPGGGNRGDRGFMQMLAWLRSHEGSSQALNGDAPSPIHVAMAPGWIAGDTREDSVTLMSTLTAATQSDAAVACGGAAAATARKGAIDKYLGHFRDGPLTFDAAPGNSGGAPTDCGPGPTDAEREAATTLTCSALASAGAREVVRSLVVYSDKGSAAFDRFFADRAHAGGVVIRRIDIAHRMKPRIVKLTGRAAAGDRSIHRMKASVIVLEPDDGSIKTAFTL